MKARTDYVSHFKEIEVGGDPEVSGNGLLLSPAAASADPTIEAKGDDTNVSLRVKPKGTGGFGYATGVGGTVTQATSKSTGVTLNKITGEITMNGAALAAAAEVSFTVTNSTVAAADVVVACIKSGATAGAYTLQVDAVAAGSFRLSLGNVSAGSLSEAVVITFAVIKSVTA